MKNLLAFLILSFTLALPPALADKASFEADYKAMKAAAKLWNYSTKKFDQFLNPFHGPTKFHLSEKRAPWAGNYFAMERGGLASRWQDQNKGMITAEELSNLEWLNRLTPEQIHKLSPAEKYDLLNSNYELPMTRTELIQRGPQRPLPVKEWEGFCNGVRCAGINLKEPKHAVTVTNAEGLQITFEPADLKALAGASYFYVERYAQLGSPSRQAEFAFKPPNPAIFDLSLRYFLAKKKRAFVVDSSLDAEVWNESVTGFKRTLGPNSEGKPQTLTYTDRTLYPWAHSKIEIVGTLDSMGEVEVQESNERTQRQVSQGKYSQPIKIHYEGIPRNRFI